MQRLTVSASCPSCGAPFELLEGANVARCPFCDLPLLFQSRKKILKYYLEPNLERRSIAFLVDRHRKRNGQPLSKRIDQSGLLYLPFWRFAAEAFYFIRSRPALSANPALPDVEPESQEIKTKDWDVNFAAHTSGNLGIATLGMRADWLRLKIMTDRTCLEEQGRVLSIEADSSAAKEKAARSLNFYLDRKKAPEDELVLKLLEERLSLVYFPLWVANFTTSEGKFFHVIDGITKRTLKEGSGHFPSERESKEDAEEFHPLGIVPHCCPNCGWDLPVTSFHLVFPCDNCRRIWKVQEGAYRQIRGEIAKAREEPSAGRTKPLGYYPFWVFEARIGKEKPSSIKDIFELLPSEIGLFSAEDKSRPFLFHVPAFELGNLKKVADIGLAYLRTQPVFETERVKRENTKGVFISEDDAKKMAEMLWLNLISQKSNLDLSGWENPEFENGRIVWCPCYKEGTFLKDAVIGYSFQNVR